VYDRAWCEDGIRHVKDIMTDLGEIRRQHLERKVSQKGGLILKLNKVMKAIPRLWKEILKTDGVANTHNTSVNDDILCMHVGGEIVNIQNLSRKCVCQILMPIRSMSQCELYWENKFGHIEWQYIYSCVQSNPLLSRKIKEFQWKVLNRCITTENKIKHFADSNGVCKLCGLEIENVEHMLVDCESLGEYWNCVFRLMRLLYDISIDESMFFTGIQLTNPECTDVEKVLNFILEESKWMVWKRRCIVRYDDVWLNDKQMVHMLENRLTDRITNLMYEYQHFNQKIFGVTTQELLEKIKTDIRPI
jgi:hypothetical protein